MMRAPATALKTFRRCLDLLQERDRRRLGVLVGLAAVVSVLEAVSALLVYLLVQMATSGVGTAEIPLLGDLRERFSGSTEEAIFTGVAICVAVAFLVRGGLYLFQTYAQQRVAHNAGVKLSTGMVRGYLDLPYEFHLQRNSAQLIRNVYTAVLDLVIHVLVPGMAVLSETLIIAGLLIALFVSAPLPSTLAVAILIPTVSAILALVAPRLKRQGIQNQQSAEDSLRMLQQGFGGVKEIKLAGASGFFSELYRASRGRIASSLYNRALLVEAPRIGIETMAVLFLVGFLSVSFTSEGSLEDALATLGLFAYAVLRALPSLNRVISNVNSVRYGIPAVDLLHEDLVRFEDRHGSTPVVPAAAPFDFEREVRFEKVGFTYEGSDRDVLSSVDLVVPKGGSLGIIGPTGSGKSTLVDLLLGLIEPTTGRITVDGGDMTQMRASWQSALGVVPQTVFLLDDTLRNNIAFGVSEGEVEDARLERVVEQAQLSEFVGTLPDGLLTVVGERGVRLSGGQRQRIAIARALYRDPKVLVFDEATSALDSATEKQVIEGIERLTGERTVVLVAHRLSTVALCRSVVLVRDGRLVDAGTLNELLARHPELRTEEMTR